MDFDIIGLPHRDLLAAEYAGTAAFANDGRAPLVAGVEPNSGFGPSLLAHELALVRQPRREGPVPPDAPTRRGRHQAKRPPEAADTVLDVGPGFPVPSDVSKRMEADGGTLGGITFHTGPDAGLSATRHGALALTSGSRVAFAPGWYRPGTPAGDSLIAHELAHALQSRSRGPEGTPEQLEADAEEGRRRLLAGQPYASRFAAPAAAVLGFGATGAAELISSFTSWGNLDEMGLGTRLFELAWMTPNHYTYVTEVIQELGSSNRDDVALVFSQRARDENLEEFARTPEGVTMLKTLGSEMQGGWFSDAERLQVSRIWASISLVETAAKARAAAEKLLDAAAARKPGSKPGVIPPLLLDAAQLETKLRLIGEVLARLSVTYSKDADVLVTVSAATATVGLLRSRLTADTAGELTPLITAAQLGSARIEDGLRQLDIIRLDAARSGDYGPQLEASLAIIAKLRGTYLRALASILTPGGTDAFLDADRMAAALPRALTEIQLARFERTSGFALIDSWREQVTEWVAWTRAKLDVFSAESDAIGAERAAGRPVDSARLEALRAQHETLELSIRGIEQWDRVLTGWVYINTHGSQTVHLFSDQYGAVTTMLVRCQGMKTAATSGDLADLRTRVTAFSTDPAIATWFRALPMIAGVSTVVRSLSITLVAAMVSAGIGGLLRAGTAGYAAGDAALIVRLGATQFTSRQAAVFAGSVALESLAFTATHRALETAVSGEAAGSGLVELAWNVGLFSLLRLSSLGVKEAMTARGLEAGAAPVQHTVAFGLLQAYGATRFRIEHNRWPNSDEFGQMTLETLVLMLGIGLATGSVSRFFAAQEQAAKHRNLFAFEKAYGEDFAALEIDRSALNEHFRAALSGGRADDVTVRAQFEKRAAALEQRMKALLERVKTEGKVDLAGLQAEMKTADFPQLELSQGLLARALGLPENVGLRFEGAEGQYSYRFGGTGQIESRLRAIGAIVDKTIDPASGLRMILVTFPNQRPTTFAERPDIFPAGEQHRVDPANAAFQALRVDFAIPEGRLSQYASWLVQGEMARTNGQMNSAVQEVRRHFEELRKRAADEGRTFPDLLAEQATRGRLSLHYPKEAGIANQLEAAGILQDPMWRNARTEAEFSGAVAEMMAVIEAQARATASGHRLLRGVRIRGNLYRDAALKDIHRTDTDVVPEIDLVTVSEQGGTFVVHGVGNVKGYAGAADAASQNTQSLAVLRSVIAGASAEVTSREGARFWARVSTITAIDPATGMTVELAGHLAERPGGAATETIGPSKASGFDRSLTVTGKQIELIGRILRERSSSERLGLR